MLKTTYILKLYIYNFFFLPYWELHQSVAMNSRQNVSHYFCIVCMEIKNIHLANKYFIYDHFGFLLKYDIFFCWGHCFFGGGLRKICTVIIIIIVHDY